MAQFEPVVVEVKAKTSGFDKDIDKVTRKLERMARAAEKVQNQGLLSENGGIVEGLKEIIDGSEKASKSVKKFSDSFSSLGKTVGRIGKLMAIRAALRAIISATKEGINNLKEWQNANGILGNVGEKANNASAAITVLKNSLAVVVAPAFNLIADGLVAVAKWAMTAANAVSRFYAIVGGKSSYTAVKWVDSVASGMSSAGSATRKAKEELKDYLMGFDELNVIHPDTENYTGGRGGGGSDIGAIQDMFVQLDTYSEEALKRWEEVKKEYEKGFDGSPRSFIQGADPTGKGHMTTAWLDWDTLREKSAESWGRLRTYLHGDDPTGKGHMTDWWLGVKTYLQGDDPTGKGHMTSFWWEDLDKFFQKFSGGKNGHLVNIEPNAGYWTGKWDALKKKMSKIKWTEILKSNPTGAGSLREAVSNAMGKGNPFQSLKQKWDELCKDFKNVVGYIKEGDWDGLLTYMKDKFEKGGEESGDKFNNGINDKLEVTKSKVDGVATKFDKVNKNASDANTSASNLSSTVSKFTSKNLDENVAKPLGLAKGYSKDTASSVDDIKTNAGKIGTNTFKNLKDPLKDASGYATNIESKLSGINGKNYKVNVQQEVFVNMSTLKFKIGDKTYNAVESKNGGFDLMPAAAGGMFDTGQMFIAREAGPELVGTIGSQSAVVNNTQIVEAVSQGVARAVSSVFGGGFGQNDGASYNLYLDGRQILTSVKETQTALGVNIMSGNINYAY